MFKARSHTWDRVGLAGTGPVFRASCVVVGPDALLRSSYLVARGSKAGLVSVGPARLHVCEHGPLQAC